MRLKLAAMVLLASGVGWTQAPTPAAQPDAPKQIRAGGQVQQAKLLQKVQPEYPPLARQARIEGTVRLEATLSTDGTVRELKVISGPPLLVSSALEAVKNWRYQPTLLNGRPVEVVTTIDVVYALGVSETGEAEAMKAEQTALAAVDPATAADIRRLMEVTGAKELGMQVAAPLFEQVKPTLLRTLPPGGQSEKMASLFVEKMLARVEDEHFLDVLIPVYAKHYTHEEIKAILAFFESPIGQRYVQELQPMLQEVHRSAVDHWKKIVLPQVMRETAAGFAELKQSPSEYCHYVCPTCREYCVLRILHSGMHSCKNGHTWW